MGRSLTSKWGAGRRRFHALIEITYVAGSLPHAAEAIAAALRTAAGELAPTLSFAVLPQPHNIVAVSATMRAGSPSEAASQINAVLDRSLLTTGLHAEHDLTGRVLRVAPLEPCGS